jgi:hypothetical protein
METLELFLAPSHCRKLVHRWLDRHRTPVIREVR